MGNSEQVLVLLQNPKLNSAHYGGSNERVWVKMFLMTSPCVVYFLKQHKSPNPGGNDATENFSLKYLFADSMSLNLIHQVLKNPSFEDVRIVFSAFCNSEGHLIHKIKSFG